MAILPLNEAAATAPGLMTSPLGSATPGGMSQLLEILKLVNDIVHSPLASSMAARFQGPNQGQVLQQSPIIDAAPVQQQPQQQQPVQLPAPAAAPPQAPVPVLDEKKFIEMLMTPQGRAMMDRGLQQIKDLGGDLTISQMQDLLRSGKPLEPQEKKNGDGSDS